MFILCPSDLHILNLQKSNRNSVPLCVRVKKQHNHPPAVVGSYFASAASCSQGFFCFFQSFFQKVSPILWHFKKSVIV